MKHDDLAECVRPVEAWRHVAATAPALVEALEDPLKRVPKPEGSVH